MNFMSSLQTVCAPFLRDPPATDAFYISFHSATHCLQAKCFYEMIMPMRVVTGSRCKINRYPTSFILKRIVEDGDWKADTSGPDMNWFNHQKDFCKKLLFLREVTEI